MSLFASQLLQSDPKIYAHDYDTQHSQVGNLQENHQSRLSFFFFQSVENVIYAGEVDLWTFFGDDVVVFLIILSS